MEFEEINIENVDKDKFNLLLITATKVETKYVRKLMSPLSEDSKLIKTYDGSANYILGLFAEYSAVHVESTGMGSTGRDASLTTTIDAIALWEPNAVVMVGICFGRDESLQNIGDILISEKICPYELARVGDIEISRAPKPQSDATLLNRFGQYSKWYSRKQKKSVKVEKVSILSGEKLVDNLEFKTKLFNSFPEAKGGEMEGAGIYAACDRKRVPWIMVKSICDWGEGKSDYGQEYAAYNAANFSKEVFSSKIAFLDLNLIPVEKLPLVHDESEDKIIKGIKYQNIKGHEIVKLCHPRHTVEPILRETNSDKGISYEFISVEIANGIDIGYLFLNKYINLQNTFKNLEGQITKYYSSITVCSPKIIRKNSTKIIDRLINIDKGLKKIKFYKTAKNIELIYIDDFVWKFCLANIVSKLDREISVDENFIDQELFGFTEYGRKYLDTSLHYFEQLFKKREVQNPVNLVIGRGGVGKTTFCEHLVGLANSFEKKHAILISSTDLRYAKVQFNINTVTDLYRLYVEINRIEFSNILEPDNLEINLSCGNIILIIDGIDEIESILQDKFNIDSFLRSIEDLNNSYSNCLIIATSRDHHVDKYLKRKNIDILNIYGFDDTKVDLYLKKRLTEIQAKEAKKYLIDLDIVEDGRLAPIYISLISDILERETPKRKDSQIFYQSEYIDPTNPLDKLIYKLLDREISKQRLSIKIDDIFDILVEIAIRSRGVISKEKFDEFISIMFTNGIATKREFTRFYVNPLLKYEKKSQTFTIRYDYILNWIKTKFLIYHIINQKFDDELIEIFSEMYNGYSLVFQLSHQALQLKKNEIVDSIKNILKTTTQKINQYFLEEAVGKRIKAEKAVSGILHLIFELFKSVSKKEKTELLIELYGSKTVRNLRIYGDFYPLDFNNIQIYDSYFDGFTNFEKSEFPKNKTVFYYTEFRNIDPNISHIDNKILFDRTCKLNESLEDAFIQCIDDVADITARIKTDIQKILRVGYRSGGFVWKSKSLYVSQCRSFKANINLKNYISILIENGLLEKKRNKFDRGYGYEVSTKFRIAAKDLIENESLKLEIEDIINKILESNYGI